MEIKLKFKLGHKMSVQVNLLMTQVYVSIYQTIWL